MFYENTETFLNEEVRRPIKHHLKGVDEKKAKRIMEVVDFLCDKHREVNAFAQYPENVAGGKLNFNDYMAYRMEKCKQINYDELECPFTEEELMAREEEMEIDENED